MGTEPLFRAIFERASDTIIVTDDETRIVAVNPAGEDLLGRTATELRSLSVRDIVRPSGEHTARLWARFRAEGRQRGEIDIVRGDGNVVPVEYAAFTSGVVGQHVSIMRDVSARREEDRARDRLLATVSHELRNPINAILGWAELLLDDAPSDRVRDGLGRIVRNARAQALLVDDLLDVARIARGELRLTPSEVDPVLLVRTALENVHRDVVDRELTLTVGPSVRPIVADPERLGQIVANLVSNAVKFSAPGDRIAVRVLRENDETVIVVEDGGEGIEPELLPHLFVPFRRGDASSTRRHGGLGLGLSIVYHLVTLHGGTITAESEGPGCGSRFTVRLLDEPPGGGRPSTPASESPSPERLREVRVLVCEDDADSRAALANGLRRFGATVLATGSVREALATLRDHSIDVIVTDISMPHEDGYELARAVRSLGGPPVIAVTARAGEAESERALAAGFVAHVAKPVSVVDLVEHVHRASSARPGV